MSKVVKNKRTKNLSNLYEEILENEPTKNNVTNKHKVEELMELTKTPKKENWKESPHYNVLQPNYLNEADLLFLPTAAFGYRYLLVVTDVNTKRCDAEPIKNKDAITVTKAITKLYNRGILEKPQLLGVDPGGEFKGPFEEYCDDNKITLKVGHANRHRQQSLVEAKNKIIGSNIAKILARKELETGKNSKNWIPYLRILIDKINEAIPKPETELSNLEPVISQSNMNLLPIGTRVRVLLDEPKDVNGKRLYGGFRSGDIRWSREIHKIENFVLLPSEPPMYTVTNENNMYRTIQQLQPVKESFV